MFCPNHVYYHQHHGVLAVSHLFFINITGCHFSSPLFSITSRVIPSFLICSFSRWWGVLDSLTCLISATLILS